MIFRYPGGKSRKSVREKIFSRFPEYYEEYRDPMVGGGGIFWHVPTDKKRWINDINNNLMDVYVSLCMRPREFIHDCRTLAPQDCDTKLLKETFDYVLKNDRIDNALRYLFVNRTVWGGRVNYDIPSRLYFSNPQGWKIVYTKKMWEAANILSEACITNTSYEPLLEYPGKDVLIYLDPPYYKNTQLTKTSRLYQHNFEIEDHERLAEQANKCKHKVIISYDDCSMIRSLYKGWNIGNDSWTYCGTSSAKGHSKTKTEGKELIITNY